MLLKNSSVLFGRNLKYIDSINLKIHNHVFSRIGKNLRPSTKEEYFDCENLLLIPGFINAHTHIGDSIGKDLGLDGNVDSKIHPVFGLKQKLLKETKPSHLARFMKKTCNSMLKKGITTFVDFREGGLDGIVLLKKVLSETPIRGIILGRTEYYQEHKQIQQNHPFPNTKSSVLDEILKKCDGIGISGTNENSNSVLRHYSNTKKIRAIHSAETIQSSQVSRKITGKSETQRALLLKPHFLVHMTYATKSDLHLAAKKTRGIVICPRANAALSEGIPDITQMLQAKCNLTLGTDNVMINSPDIFREMDYLWKVTMGIHKKRIDPKTILKMATVNAAKLLHKKIGMIETNCLADGIFIDKDSIDLDPMNNVHASIVHRASQSSIKAVMVGGKIVHGKI